MNFEIIDAALKAGEEQLDSMLPTDPRREDFQMLLKRIDGMARLIDGVNLSQCSINQTLYRDAEDLAADEETAKLLVAALDELNNY